MFLVFLNHFDILMSKIIFKNKTNIIGMYFDMKNYLKNNCSYTAKIVWYYGSFCGYGSKKIVL